MFERFEYKKVSKQSVSQKREGKKMLFSLLFFVLLTAITSFVMKMLSFQGEEILGVDLLLFILYAIVAISVFGIRYQKNGSGMPRDFVMYVIYENQLYYVAAVILANSKYVHANSSHTNAGDHEKDELTKRNFRDSRFIMKLICGEESYEQIIVHKLSPIKSISRKTKDTDFFTIKSAVGSVRVYNNLDRYDEFYEIITYL